VIQARFVKRFPAFSLDVEVEAKPGVTVLYGASGAGKTLTLDCLAGFTAPDSGRIMLDERILFDAAARVNLPPRHRDCGYVFQNYALFPHMTLWQNLAFAAERHPRLERHRRVNEMLERFRILEHAAKLPNEVSGGQKQRCSIARALITQPRLLLLDEPSRGLDSFLRNELYQLVGQIRADYRIPIVLVTHDLDECFALGDTVLVYRDGRILQSGAPRKVYSQPATPEVARTLGVTNIFEAEILALDPGRNTSRVRALGQELAGTYFPGRLLGDRVWMCVPPSELRIQERTGENRVPVRLKHVLERADSVRLEFEPLVTVELSRSEYAGHTERQHGKSEWLVEFPPSALRLTG